MAVFDLTYRYPTTAAGPTAAQAAVVNSVVADVATAASSKEDDTDIIHNLGLSADGTDGRPEIGVVQLAGDVALTSISVVVKDANTVTVKKNLKGANTAATFRVTIKRPHTITR